VITLRIEHAITDLETWMTAFGQFTDVRAGAGVRTERIFQPDGESQFITLDLDFDTVEAAEGFEQFLRANVWSSPNASPALGGEVKTQILVLRRSS
jgi:hypothetical protein